MAKTEGNISLIDHVALVSLCVLVILENTLCNASKVWCSKHSSIEN